MAKKIISLSVAAVFVLSSCFSFAASAKAKNDYSGKLVKIDGLTSLYYVTSEGTRYVFPNEKTYKTWFLDFDDVMTLTRDELNDIPLVGNVVYRPGVLLVKIQTDPKIYAVSQNGILRWIKTENLAKSLYGENWNLLVDDVPDSFFVNYSIGDPIDSLSDYDPDDEVDNVDSIERNHGLALGHAKKARTGRCHMVSPNASAVSVFARQCYGSINDDDDDDDASSTGNPYISSIVVANGGQEGYIDVDDTITINFSEAIDPETINEDLEAGDYVTDVSHSETGGVIVTSSGKVIVDDIAEFDMGSVDYSENFRVKLALSLNGKALTITLTSGSDVEIAEEDFDDASQTGGVIKDLDGNAMISDSTINDPTGSFGGVESESPYITSIEVVNDGQDGYIDVDDQIIITFSEPIDPESINEDLEEGDYVTGVSYLNTGGVRVSSSGKVTINEITSFDMGSVDNSETFTVKLDLSSSGKVLEITLTSGSDVEITEEDLEDASQTGGVIKDLDGDEMESDSSISDPTGTFGGSLGDASGDPYITEIEAVDGGYEGFIDQDDQIIITFSEPIDPESINDDLEEDGYVNTVLYSETGGVRVTSAGELIITDIAVFNVGDVAYDEEFVVQLALNSTGRILTITLTGTDDAEITEEDLDNARQTGGTVLDLDGNEMENDSSIADPIGTFGGDYDDGSDDSSNPYITSIEVYNGGSSGYIDTQDYIVLTFNESLDPESINEDLEEGDYVTGVSYSEPGGVRVSSSGKVSINEIASFDMGSVDYSETFTVKLALNSTGKKLTITLTSGTDVEITDEDFGDAAQIGGTVEDNDGNAMDSDSSISDPTGTFGGDNDSGDDSGNPYIVDVEIDNGGTSGYIDVGDTVTITFNESIEPESINDDLEAGDYVTGVPYSITGGVNVFSAGAFVVEGICIFDVGSVNSAGTFTSRLDLSSNGEELTVTITGGSSIWVSEEDLGTTTQTGGTIEDESGNEMSDSTTSRPSGRF